MSINYLKSTEECKTSFDKLYKRYHQSLIFLAHKLLRDKLVAEDIATEVFIRYWHKEKDFTNEVAIKSFLRKSIKNACINYLLKMQRQKKRTKLLINSLEQNEDFVLNTITQAELIIEAWNIIETLSPECRRVIIHGYVKNIDNKKIAQLLKLSTQTVANHKTRGLRLIRGRFKDLERITK